MFFLSQVMIGHILYLYNKQDWVGQWLTFSSFDQLQVEEV